MPILNPKYEEVAPRAVPFRAMPYSPVLSNGGADDLPHSELPFLITQVPQFRDQRVAATVAAELTAEALQFFAYGPRRESRPYVSYGPALSGEPNEDTLVMGPYQGNVYGRY